MTVPYIDLGGDWDEQELQAVRETYESGVLAEGPRTAEFEARFAEFTGAKHAISTNNCTTALYLATQLVGLKPGDEVITTPLTFIATNLPILARGAKPVFCDIDPRTFNLDPNQVADRITSRTKAIYPVHYAGLPVDMDPLTEIARANGLAIVEDAAHAVGARYKDRMVGNIGDFTCFSFQSLKNMTTMGDGGMLTTNDDEAAGRARRLRTFGIVHLPDRPNKYGVRDLEPPFYWDVQSFRGEIGTNYRLSEPRAAVGLVQLAKLKGFNERRRQIGHHLSRELQDVPGLTVPYEPPDCHHVFHLYTLRVSEDAVGSKDDFMREMVENEEVDVWTQYCPNYLYTLYRERGYRRGLCPVCEEVFFKELVNLPIYVRLTDAQVEHMVGAVKRTVEKRAGQMRTAKGK